MPLNCMQSLRNYIHPKNVYEAMRPLVTISSYMGLIPVVLAGNPPNRHYRVAWTGYLKTLIHIVLFFLAFLRSLRTPSLFSYFFISDEITDVASLIQIISAFAAMGAMYGICFAKRYSFVAAVDMFHQIDRSLEEMGVKHDFGATMRSVCRGLLGTFAILTVYIAGCVMLVQFSDDPIGITTFVTYFMPHIVEAQIVFPYGIMLRQIVRQMNCVNEILAKLHQNTNLEHQRKHRRGISKTLKSVEIGSLAPECIKETKDDDRVPVENTNEPTVSDTKKQLSGCENAPDGLADSPAASPDPDLLNETNSEEETIRKACDIHEELCDACYITEEYFSIVMLTIITIGFLIIVFNAYYVLEVTLRHTGQIDVETKSFIIFLVYQMFIHGLGLLVIVQNSSSVIEANERCSIHVHKLLCRVKSEAARQKLLEFSLQLLNRNIRFTAYNLFPLDRTLIFTIIGAATTYLIILVQFSIQFR